MEHLVERWMKWADSWYRDALILHKQGHEFNIAYMMGIAIDCWLKAILMHNGDIKEAEAITRLTRYHFDRARWYLVKSMFINSKDEALILSAVSLKPHSVEEMNFTKEEVAEIVDIAKRIYKAVKKALK